MIVSDGTLPAAEPSATRPPRDVVAVVLAGGLGKRMQSDLPKVLHRLNGRPLIDHVIERVRMAGVDDVILVVGHRREAIQEHMGDSFRYAVQEQPQGTAHAVMIARPLLERHTGRVLVVYGDMPLLNPDSMRRLIERCQGEVKAAILTIVLDNPPDFGRVVRDAGGRIQRIVEVRDADPATLAIHEVNVGTYCFDGPALLAALGHLSNDNAQGEYYLTDVAEHIVAAGGRVESIVAPTPEETLGINNPAQLRFAEALQHLDYAESLYPLVDADPAIVRPSHAPGSPP